MFHICLGGSGTGYGGRGEIGGGAVGGKVGLNEKEELGGVLRGEMEDSGPFISIETSNIEE